MATDDETQTKVTMNIMKRLVSQSARDDGHMSSSETSLALSHLNKLFADIKANAPPFGSSQQNNEVFELKIYNILPLFCKVSVHCHRWLNTSLDIPIGVRHCFSELGNRW